MNQLSILDYQPTPEEMTQPIAPAAKKEDVNQSAIAYWSAAADVYWRILLRIAQTDRLPVHVKRHEVNRLHEMRMQALRRSGKS